MVSFFGDVHIWPCFFKVLFMEPAMVFFLLGTFTFFKRDLFRIALCIFIFGHGIITRKGICKCPCYSHFSCLACQPTSISLQGHKRFIGKILPLYEVWDLGREIGVKPILVHPCFCTSVGL